MDPGDQLGLDLGIQKDRNIPVQDVHAPEQERVRTTGIRRNVDSGLDKNEGADRRGPGFAKESRVINLEWRIPWPAEWGRGKKTQAAERLCDYINTGTLYDREKRMLAKAVVKGGGNDATQASDHPSVSDNSPYLLITLER
jgi:hypothetical protein